MNSDIYQQELKQLAKDASGAVKFSADEKNSSHCVTLDNPLCGDRVTMAAEIESGKFISVTHEVRGCLLCQASSSIIAKNTIGRSIEEIVEVAAITRGMLINSEADKLIDWPNKAWRDLGLFQPVAKHKSRHGCVLLPFNTLVKLLASH